jgi:prevent-host-death family protein
MCYMARQNRRVGVRQLRQNLSRYLRRVKAGQALEVTERGQVVAVLAPIAATGSPLERLVAAGRASAPHGDLLKMGPPTGPVSTRASEALQELRDERR